MCGRVLCRSLILLLGVVVVTLAVPARAEEAVDPQSLVGEWTGTWTNKQWGGHGTAGTGDYILTIDRVDGTQVYGRGKFRGPKGTNEFDVVGRLEGHRLTYGKEPVTKLLIQAGSMTGTSEGRLTRDITLYKRK